MLYKVVSKEQKNVVLCVPYYFALCIPMYNELQSKEELAAQRQWLYGKSMTIAVGTMEVQKNIIAKAILGL